jgi:uncharacterized membrane protein YdjX (TVP38/TMEM64 family)
MAPANELQKDTTPNRSLTRALAAAGILLAAILFGRWAGAFVPELRTWVESLGPWGPVAFILVYAVAAVALVPASILTLGAGALFGVVAGTAYVFVAAVLGSAMAFLIARYVARSTVERRIERDPRFASVDRAIATEGRKIVLLLRLSPVFPFNLLNYALGLTRISFADYLVASIGMLPATLMYVYLGSLGTDVAAAAGGAAAERSNAEWALLAVGLAATVAVTISVTRVARKALTEATQ